MSKKITKFFLKLIVSLGLIGYLIWRVDWHQTWLDLHEANLFWIFLYLLLFAVGVFISAWKWRVLSSYLEVSGKFFYFLKLYWTGTFINNFLPGFIGGDGFKIYQLGKKNGKMKEAAAGVVMDRLSGLIGALILFLVFATWNLAIIKNSPILFFLLLGGWISLVFLVILQFSFNLDIWRRFFNFLPQKVVNFSSILRRYSETKILAKSILMSFLFSLVGLALANYVLFLALGIKIDVLNYLSVIFLCSIVSSIPISINNIGIKEWAYATFFGFFGIPLGVAVLVAFVSRILQMLISCLALPFYLQNRKK